MRSPRTIPNRPRAVVAPYVAVMLVVLLSFAALAVDLGYLYNSTLQMQNAVDSAALAGASGLDTDAATAQTRALNYGGQNVIGVTALQSGETTVEVGSWEATSRAFTAVVGGEVISPNAVRVEGDRHGVALYFANIMGISTADVTKDAVALLQSGVCMGVWALEGIAAAGDIYTDSFDARDGAYGPGNINANGDLCSNQNVDLQGSVEIHGDTMYGQGYALTTSGNAYEVWGVIDDHCCPVAVPPFDIAIAMVSNDNASIGWCQNSPGPVNSRTPFDNLGPWNLLSDGYCREIHLGTPGSLSTYYFNSLEITAQGQIFVDGPTEIYLDGSGLFTGGGITNTSQDPRDLKIFSTDTTMTLDGSAGFYGVVVAPDADIVLTGTGDYYGAILGKTLDVSGNASIHVDEASVFEVFGIDGPYPTLVK